MAMFYFDHFDGSGVIQDIEGQDIADLANVHTEAALTVRELIEIVVGRGEAIDHRELRVRNDAGQTVLTLPFRDFLGLDAA
jgi:hypothetical protein